MQQTNYWIAILINIVFLFFSFKLAISTDLIKDDSIQDNKPYSYAKSQLFWWTVIIISIFIWCAVFDKGIPQLTTLCMALLGISVGTTTAGALIDNADKNTKNVMRHQDFNNSTSFLRDILSDKQGNYSIHRFQSLIFNLSIGIIFIWVYINQADKTKFPDFGDNETKYVLGLLGISNLGYAGLKIGENSTRKDAVNDQQIQGKTNKEIIAMHKPE